MVYRRYDSVIFLVPSQRGSIAWSTIVFNAGAFDGDFQVCRWLRGRFARDEAARREYLTSNVLHLSKNHVHALASWLANSLVKGIRMWAIYSV